MRDAFETSVTKLLPSVREKISHVSIVPKRSRPCRASAFARGTLSRIHFIFVPEKYGSMIRPVVLWMYSSNPCAFSHSHSGAVRRHCQTIALQIGMPVSASQATVVSRWFVMLIAAMSSAVMSASCTACRIA